MGVLSYGDVKIQVTNEYNSILTIGFFRPEYVNVFVKVNITPREGYTSEVGTQIQQAIYNYITSLKIGNNLFNSQLWEAALSVSPDIKPYFSIDPLKGILIGTASGSEALQDIGATFKQKFTSTPENIQIIVSE